MPESYLRTPGEVAKDLGLSASTLRRWSTEFAAYLSPHASEPAPAEGGGHTHRRYTAEDVAVLARARDLLAQGHTYDQVRRQLDQGPCADPAQNTMPAQRTQEQPAPAALQTLNFLSTAMHSMADGQQLLLNSQQANRDLLNLVVQDNFNLKEENARLREQMMRLEQELSENRRREEAKREMLERRLERLESRLYDPPEPEPAPPEEPPRKGWLARFLGL